MLTKIRLSRTRFVPIRRFSTGLIVAAVLISSGLLLARSTAGAAARDFVLRTESTVNKLIKRIAPPSHQITTAAASPKVAPAAPFTAYTVNSLADTNTGSGTSGTLRYCITQTNAAGGTNTITFSVTGTITLTSTLPTINNNLTIDGPGPTLLTINGNNSVRVVSINSGFTVTFQDLTIANGHATNLQGGAIDSNNDTVTLSNCVFDSNFATFDGGAVRNNGGNMTVTGCTFSNNTSAEPSGQGGGIKQNGTSLTVTNTTFINNSADAGGGLHVGTGTTNTTLTNCTFYGNTATFGGAVEARAAATFQNCTFYRNVASATGGINVIVQPTTLINTIVSGNLDPNGNPSDIEKGGTGSINTAGSFNNLIGTPGSTGLTNGTNGNQVGVLDPKVVPPANYGGLVPTVPIRPSSPARNAGRNTGAPATDARGFNRPQATTVDIGAFELQTNSLVTNTLNSGAGSMRNVIAAVPAFEIVQFESPLFDSPQTISLSGGQITLSKNQAVVGPAASLLTVQDTASASTTSRAFLISSGVTAILGDMKIANNTVTSEGGAISNGGTLTVRACVVDNNTSVNEGGGIASGAITTLTVIDSTISNNTSTTLHGGGIGSYGVVTVTGSTFIGNSANFSGGGIALLNGGGQNGSLTAINSTFSANQAAVTGGGLYFDTAVTTNTITNCTITLNQQINLGSSGGGIGIPGGTVTLKNTIVVGNIRNDGSPTDITTTGGSVAAASSFNLIGTGGSGGLTNGVNSNQVGVADAKLVALGNYGGPTQTHLLSINSPAINAGTATGAPTTDQRGVTRSLGGTYDIGAVESYITVSPTTVPTGTVGTTYAGQTFSASGGSDDYTFGLTGTLPTGMFFSPVGADISGTPTQSGSFPITATATDNTNGIVGASSYTLTINPQILHHFAIASIGSPKTAGTAFNITITAQDASNNTVLGFNGTVNLSTNAGTITPTTSGAFTSGVLTQSVTVTQSGTLKTISVNDGSGHTGTSNTFTVNPGAVDHFAIGNISSPQTAGTAFNITLTAQDANNNTVTSFTGTVGLSTTAGTISPTTSSAFTSGTRTQSVTVTQAGTGRTITADDGTGHTGTSNTFTVNAGALHHFAIGNISTQTAGTAFNISLTAQDANNNTVTSFTSTVSLTTTAGTITPTTSSAFTAGTLNQSVTVTQAGTGKTITVNDGASHTGTSNTFTVNAGTLHHFAVGNVSSPQIAGTAFNVVLTAQDANNNTVTSFTGTVGLTTTAGTISPTTSSAFTAGALTQSVAVTQAGTGKTITVDDGGGHTGTSNTFAVNVGALHHFAIGNISTQTAGTAFNITLTAQDLNNNTVTSFTGTVGLSTTAGTITPAISGAFASGLRTESVTVTQAGMGKTISANDGAGHTATSNAFTVNPGALHHFAIGNIGSQATNVAFNISLTAQDANNNTATSFTGTVNLSTTAGTISPTTSGAFTGGTRTQSVTVSQAGTGRTISLDDGSGHTGTSNGFTVIASNTPPSITAQTGISRQQGSPASNSPIATVSDAEQAANALIVTVTSANPSNGVTISNIVNSNGAITADIIASCVATNASFTLQVSDGTLTNTASLAVSVTANAAPTVSYGNASALAGGSTTTSPTTASDNGSITGYAVQSQGTYTGTISVNPSGVVSISNAAPAGSHTITIRATDNCGTTADASFTLNVGCVTSLSVNNLGDGADATPGNGVCETAAGNGVCTLRAAIQEANAMAVCSPLTINFSVTGTIATATTLPGIVHPNLTISGPGANQLTVSAVPSDHQLFTAGAANINLSLSGLTLTGGFAGSGVNAGAIEFNSTNGQLNLTACALIGIGGSGGKSLIYSNLSGGITITDSTISGNTTGYGITADRTPLTLTNSTISGNAFYGIHVSPATTPTSITLLNCTIANNGQQGIVFESFIGGGGTITTKNSIFAGSPSLQINKGPGVTLVSQGNNLCSDATLSPTAAGDLINTNPLLASLSNYGGPTPTHALLPGSPAINAGSLTGAPTTDQRGIARVGNVDIGAFESRGFTLAMGSGNNQSAFTNTAFANPLSVTVASAFSEPVNGGQVTFTPPGSGASATIAGTPATITGGAATTGTVTANAIIGGPYTVTATANGATPAINFSLTNLNSAPTFTPAAAISRQKGSPGGAAVTSGTVSDVQTAAGSLTVTQIAGGTASGITVTGVTNTNGTITAVISADCNAVGGTVRFQVSDGNLAGTGDLTVNVAANAAPTLVYGNASVSAGGSTTNSAATATDNGSITGYAVQSQGTYTGTISVNASGVVNISAAAPVGSHTITIRATDNCGATTDATFTLNVGNNAPTITAGAALSRQQGTAGSVSTIATVSDSETPVGGLIVTATTVPAGITITGITNAAGTITATVAASCTAVTGANTIVLTVTDANSGMATANLTVNVTANAAPTLTYAAASVTAGSAMTVNTATASDNGSITGYTIVSVVPSLTTAPTVNASGVVSITNAGPSGTHTITVQATDNCGATTNASFVLTVNCQTITVTAPVTNTGTAGVAFSQTFTQTNGIGATAFSTLSTLPTGMTLSSAGVLSGTPTQTGALPIVVTATDANGCQGTVNYTLTINCQTITVTPASLSATSTGAAFSQTFTQAGGIGAITWSLIGTAPLGLSFNAATATLSGSPTTSGSFSFTIRATDQNACFGERQYTLGVDCAAITVNPANATLAGGTAGTPYSQSFTATGGQTPHSFTNSAGTLPPGLTLNSSGLLSGTPTGFGIFNFTIKATDANGCFGERAYSLRICAIITLTASLPAGTTGVTYNQTITASGGASPYGFTVTGGNLPQGLSLNSTGALTGTPTQSGPFTFTVTATDANGCTGTQSYNVTINCQTVTVNPATLANGFVATSYSQNLTASGGSAPYAFTTSAGTLPGGLTLSSSGALTGTPTAQGTFTFTIRATDANGCSGERGFTVIISGDGLVFYPLPRPVRILDTRAGQGNCDNIGTPITGGTSLTTLARLTCEGITIPANAKAITGNVTVINQTSQIGFLTIYPDGNSLPLAANMIYEPNGILSNNFTVGLSADGKFNLYGEKTLDAVVDVSGYYAPPTAGALYYHPLPKPVRLLDTRAGQGNCDSVSTPIAAGSSITTLARGTCDGVTIPATAQAITGNATVINGSGQTGYLTIYPNGVTAPLAANIVYFPGQVLSNAFTVSLNASGEFNIFGERTIDMAIDVAGYYSSEATDTNGAGLLLTPLARPLRILDTRAGQGNCDAVSTPITGGTSISTAGRLTCEGLTIPSNAQSILGNVTVVNQTATAGYLTLYPDGVTQPLVANLIYFPNQILSNAFVVGLNSDTGQFRLFAERTLDAVTDVSGFFAP